MALGRTNINLTEIPTGYEQIINYTMLYDSGDECTDVTGGWGISGYTYTGSYTLVSGTKNGDHFTFKGSAGKLTMLGTMNPIDTIGYSKAIVKGQSTKLYSNIGGFIRTVPIKDYAGIDGENLTVNIPSSVSFSEIDLSTFNTKERYFLFGCLGLRDLAIYSMFLVKNDDYLTLASKAGISATSINDILTASNTLLTNKDAVNFMVARCTGDFMASAMASETFLTALNNSPYKSVVQGNEHWSKFLAMVA